MITVDLKNGTVGYEPNLDNIIKGVKTLQSLRLNMVQDRLFLSENRRDQIVTRIERRRKYLRGI